MSGSQRVVLRLGAAALVVAAFVLGAFAVLVDSGPVSATEVTVADDPTDVPLPALGLFGGSTVVYGQVPGGGADGAPSPSGLGCRLLTADGHEQPIARLDELAAVREDPVQRDGATLVPLFTVGGYPSGSHLACADAASVAPLAVAAPRTFGSLGLLVRVVAAGGAVLCLVVAGLGLLLTRRSGGVGAAGQASGAAR